MAYFDLIHINDVHCDRLFPSPTSGDNVRHYYEVSMMNSRYNELFNVRRPLYKRRLYLLELSDFLDVLYSIL